MSHLLPPHINFAGDVRLNVPTGDNVDNVDNLDVAAAAITQQQSMSDEMVRQWLMQLKLDPHYGSPLINGGWNYFGDSSVIFENVGVISVRLPGGKLITGPGGDPFLGAAVQLLGHELPEDMTVSSSSAKMIDLDPAGNYTSQIYSGEFRLSGQDKEGHYVVFMRGANPSVACSYWVYASPTASPRSLCAGGKEAATAVWQITVANDNLTFNHTAISPLLAMFQETTRQGRGIAIRFCTHYLSNKFADLEVAQKFAQGRPVENPGYMKLIGTIGVWRAGEIKTFPIGRLLLPANKAIALVDCETQTETRMPKGGGYPASIVTRTAQPRQISFRLGPALAVIDPSRPIPVVILDLVTTFPETDKAFNKVHLGPVSLRLKTADGAWQTLGIVPYARETYQKGGGLVELPIPAHLNIQEIQEGTLALVQDTLPGTPDKPHCVLEEVSYPVIAVNDRCLYAQVGKDIIINLHLSLRGQTLNSGQSIKLSFEQYIDAVVSPGMDEAFSPQVKEDRPLNGLLPNKQILQIEATSPIVKMPRNETFIVNPDGLVQVKLKAMTPGVAMIRFVPQGMPEQEANWATDFYSCIRVLPEDDFSHIPDDELSWDFIYQNVFRYYYLLYPAMSKFIPLNNQASMEANAARIKKLMAPEAQGMTWYMPTNRDLSAGKRDLLQRWCDLVLKRTKG